MKVGDIVQPTVAAVAAFNDIDASTRGVVLPPRRGQRDWQLRLRIEGQVIRCWDSSWWKKAPKNRRKTSP